MSQQVVTELVIDSNTSGADQFSQAMGRADASAKSATGSIAGVTLAVAGVGVAVVGAIAGLRAFIDYVGTTNKGLADIATNAAAAGMSTRDFQATLFAARSAGVTEKDFVAGLDKIGADLTAASRGVTDFGKLFAANGLSIKDTNGQLISTKTALADIMGLMQNQTPQVAAAVARIVGLSKDWIPFLQESNDQLAAQKQAAESLGIIIDDGVIQKAKEFDQQWRTAVAAWDLQFKASLASILPALIQLANIAASVLNAAGAIGGFFSQHLTSVDDMSTAQITQQIADVTALRNRMADLNGEMTDFQKFRLQTTKGALGLPENADLQTVDAYIAKLKELGLAKLAAVPTTKLTVGANPTNLPAIGGDNNDAVDRAILQLSKHILTQNADTQAVGLGDAALASFRATAAETAAVQANGGAETAKQAAQFAALRVQAAAAADALARAKIANDIKFGGATAFLSAEDVAIATQLKTIYPNVTDALNSAEAAQLRFNSAAKQLSSSIESSLVTGLTDIASGTVAAGQGFTNMGVAVLKSIEQMIIKIAIVQPMMQALQASVSSSGILSFLGIGGSNAIAAGGVVPGAVGPTSVGGAALVGLHDGGIVGSEATFSRYVHPSYFDNAPKFHSGGIAGDEVPIIAKKGEGVFTPGQMAALGGGGPQTNITYAPTIDARGADAQAVARLAQAMADDRKNFQRNVQGVLAKTRANSPGAF